MEPEFPRYRKKKHRPIPKKADHKHVFRPAVTLVNQGLLGLIKDEFYIRYYCPICGKLSLDSSDLEKDGYRVNTAQKPYYCMEWSDKALREFNPETRTLPYFEIADFFAKFVELPKEVSNEKISES